MSVFSVLSLNNLVSFICTAIRSFGNPAIKQAFKSSSQEPGEVRLPQKHVTGFRSVLSPVLSISLPSVMTYLLEELGATLCREGGTSLKAAQRARHHIKRPNRTNNTKPKE